MQNFGEEENTQFYIKIYNSTKTQTCLLIKYGENINLWKTFKRFNIANSIDIIYKDSVWGKCTAKQIYNNIFNQLYDTQKEYEDDYYDKDLHQLNKNWLIKINQLGKIQEQILLGIQKRLRNTILELDNKKRQSVLFYFINTLYNIDINTDEGLQKIKAIHARVEPYIEGCCDQYGRISPFAVAFFGTGKYNISNRFNKLHTEMEKEQVEAEAEGFKGKLTVFKNINIDEELQYIADAVSDANTLLSSIGLAALQDLSDIKEEVKRYLKSSDAKLCHGLAYIRTPKSFISKWYNMAANERGKERRNGDTGITIEGIMETYINFMQASMGQAAKTKYANGIKTSIYKYPPKWVIEKQNTVEDGDARKKLENKLYNDLVSEKMFEEDQ